MHRVFVSWAESSKAPHSKITVKYRLTNTSRSGAMHEICSIGVIVIDPCCAGVKAVAHIPGRAHGERGLGGLAGHDIAAHGNSVRTGIITDRERARAGQIKGDIIAVLVTDPSRPVLHGRDFHAFCDVPDSQNDQAVGVQGDRGILAADYLNGNRGRALVFEMQGQVVAFLFRAIPGETGVAGDIVQRTADCIFTDGYAFLQIVGRFAEQVCVCRYICINRQTY